MVCNVCNLHMFRIHGLHNLQLGLALLLVESPKKERRNFSNENEGRNFDLHS